MRTSEFHHDLGASGVVVEVFSDVIDHRAAFSLSSRCNDKFTHAGCNIEQQHQLLHMILPYIISSRIRFHFKLGTKIILPYRSSHFQSRASNHCRYCAGEGNCIQFQGTIMSSIGESCT